MLDSLLKGRSLGSLSDDEYEAIKNALVAQSRGPALSAPAEIYPQLPAPEPVKPKRSIAKDLGINALKGVVGIPEAAVGLLDIPAQGAVGKALNDNLGVNFGEMKKNIEDFYGYSDEAKEKHKQVVEAFDKDGFGAGLIEAARNPSVIANTITESLPSMLAGGGAGRAVAKGLTKVAPKLSKEALAAIGAGFGEGSVSAGQQQSQFREASETGRTTPTQAGLSLLTGAGVAVLGGVSGRIASKLGIDDPEMALARGSFKAGIDRPVDLIKAIPAAMTKSAIIEGGFEEAPQSALEQALGNIGTGKPVGEGMKAAVGLGAISGAAMGAGMQPISHVSEAVARKSVNLALEEVRARKAKEEEARLAQARAEYPQHLDRIKGDITAKAISDNDVMILQSVVQDQGAEGSVREQANKLLEKHQSSLLDNVRSAFMSNAVDESHIQTLADLRNSAYPKIQEATSKAIEALNKDQSRLEETKRKESYDALQKLFKSQQQVNKEVLQDNAYETKVKNLESKIEQLQKKRNETTGEGSGPKRSAIFTQIVEARKELETIKKEQSESKAKTAAVQQLNAASDAQHVSTLTGGNQSIPTPAPSQQNASEGVLELQAPEPAPAAASQATVVNPQNNAPINEQKPAVPLAANEYEGYEPAFEESEVPAPGSKHERSAVRAGIIGKRPSAAALRKDYQESVGNAKLPKPPKIPSLLGLVRRMGGLSKSALNELGALRKGKADLKNYPALRRMAQKNGIDRIAQAMVEEGYFYPDEQAIQDNDYVRQAFPLLLDMINGAHVSTVEGEAIKLEDEELMRQATEYNSSLWRQAAGDYETMFSAIDEELASYPDEWIDYAETIAPKVKSFNDFSLRMKSRFGKAIAAVKNAIQKIWDAVKSLASGLKKKLEEERGSWSDRPSHPSQPESERVAKNKAALPEYRADVDQFPFNLLLKDENARLQAMAENSAEVLGQRINGIDWASPALLDEDEVFTTLEARSRKRDSAKREAKDDKKLLGSNDSMMRSFMMFGERGIRMAEDVVLTLVDRATRASVKQKLNADERAKIETTARAKYVKDRQTVLARKAVADASRSDALKEYTVLRPELGGRSVLGDILMRLSAHYDMGDLIRASMASYLEQTGTEVSSFADMKELPPILTELIGLNGNEKRMDVVSKLLFDSKSAAEIIYGLDRNKATSFDIAVQLLEFGRQMKALDAPISNVELGRIVGTLERYFEMGFVYTGDIDAILEQREQDAANAVPARLPQEVAPLPVTDAPAKKGKERELTGKEVTDFIANEFAGVKLTAQENKVLGFIRSAADKVANAIMSARVGATMRQVLTAAGMPNFLVDAKFLNRLAPLQTLHEKPIVRDRFVSGVKLATLISSRRTGGLTGKGYAEWRSARIAPYLARRQKAMQDRFNAIPDDQAFRDQVAAFAPIYFKALDLAMHKGARSGAHDVTPTQLVSNIDANIRSKKSDFTADQQALWNQIRKEDTKGNPLSHRLMKALMSLSTIPGMGDYFELVRQNDAFEQEEGVQEMIDILRMNDQLGQPLIDSLEYGPEVFRRAMRLINVKEQVDGVRAGKPLATQGLGLNDVVPVKYIGDDGKKHFASYARGDLVLLDAANTLIAELENVDAQIAKVSERLEEVDSQQNGEALDLLFARQEELSSQITVLKKQAGVKENLDPFVYEKMYSVSFTLNGKPIMLDKNMKPTDSKREAISSLRLTAEEIGNLMAERGYQIAHDSKGRKQLIEAVQRGRQLIHGYVNRSEMEGVAAFLEARGLLPQSTSIVGNVHEALQEIALRFSRGAIDGVTQLRELYRETATASKDIPKGDIDGAGFVQDALKSIVAAGSAINQKESDDAALGAIYVAVNKVEFLLRSAMAAGRPVLIQHLLRQSSVITKEYLTDMAEEYNRAAIALSEELGVSLVQFTPEGIYDTYLRVNGDIAKMVSQLNLQLHGAEGRLATAKAPNIDPKKNLIKTKSDADKAKDSAFFEVTATPEQIKQRELKQRLLEKHGPINLQPPVEKAQPQAAYDNTALHPREAANEQESVVLSKYRGFNLSLVGIKNRILKMFMDHIAKKMNVDLIAVVGDESFGGRYIPSETGNRASIVVNMNRSDLSVVFAHEVFHHIINKANQGDYDSFTAAIKEFVGKEKFESAVQEMASKKHPLLGKAISKPILTGSFIDNSRVRAQKGELFVGRKSLPQTVRSLEDFDLASETATVPSVTIAKSSGVQPRNYYSLRSEGNFTHNPLNPETIRPVRVPRVGDVPLSSIDGTTVGQFFGNWQLPAEMRSELENEVYADLFAQAAVSPQFWKAVGLLQKGAVKPTLAARVFTFMLQRFTESANALKGVSATDLNNPTVARLVSTWAPKVRTSEGKIYFEPNITTAIIEMVENFDPESNLRDRLERSFTGNDVANEAEFVRKKVVSPAIQAGKSAYRTVVPHGTKSYKDIMTAIEAFLDKVITWIAKNKPNGAFADFGVPEEIVQRALKVLHAGNKQRQEAELALKEFKRAFKMNPTTKAQAAEYAKANGQPEVVSLEEIHDRVSRNHDAAFFASLPQEQQNAFNKMNEMAEKIHKELVAAGILETWRPWHAGQSIRWFRNGVPLTDDELRLLGDTTDGIKIREHFTKTKVEEGTASIRVEKKLTYSTIDPLQMYFDYVNDAYRMIEIKRLVEDGINKKFEGKQLIRFFANDKDAVRAGYQKVDNDAFRILHSLYGGAYRLKYEGAGEANTESGMVTDDDGAVLVFKSEADANAYLSKNPAINASVVELQGSHRAYVATTHYNVQRQVFVQNSKYPHGEWVNVGRAPASYDTAEKAEADAKERSTENDQERYVVEPVQVDATPEVEAQMYLDPRLAKLVNVMLSRDTLRQMQIAGSFTGEDIMKLKNTLTMLELSLSTFHFFTISQEMIASYAAWAMQGNKMSGSRKINIFQAFNPLQAYKEGEHLVALVKKVMLDNSLANDPKVKEQMRQLLGSDSLDAVELYSQYFNNGGMLEHQDPTLQGGITSWGHVEYGKGKFVESFMDTWEGLRKEHPGSKLLPLSKAMLHHTLVGSTAWLMEYGIPKVKFAAFAREYAMKIEKAKAAGRPITEEFKAEIARDTMKFVEDRFGEVNWSNKWLNKSYKTALQFLFRSFTWVAGSWVALSKAGIDIAKLGWLKAKGEDYELTEKGYWGLTALAAHMATVGALSLAYFAVAGAGGDEQEDEPNTPLLTKLLFPRIDPYDNTKRVAIPSYITESYKILSHLGFMPGVHAEPAKLVTGRFNSLVGATVDLVRNEDFRGVLIRNPEDNMLKQAYDVTKHIIPIPMSFSNMAKTYQDQGVKGTMVFSLMGFSDAPASAKRSEATNLAFDLSRREYKGKETTEEEMELRDDLKRAMRKYSEGDDSEIKRMRAEGLVSARQYQIALTRYPIINNQPNPKYKDQLSQALNRLTVKSALKVYEAMTDLEKEKHAREIDKKIRNMRLRKDTPKAEQAELIAKWKELKGGE